MKIMMSAGEASGDMHAAAVAAELKRIMPEADIFGMGGADMRKSGVRIIYDIENLGIIGVVEVIRHIPFFFRLRAFLKKAMVEEKPDVLVCVDYPGFNMKLAHVAKELGIPVIYYIAPTIWAWNKGRAKNIVRDVEQVASIFPFEAEAYRKAGARVTFVGHPLADTVKPSMSFEEAMKYFHLAEHRAVLVFGKQPSFFQKAVVTDIDSQIQVRLFPPSIGKKRECLFQSVGLSAPPFVQIVRFHIDKFN